MLQRRQPLQLVLRIISAPAFPEQERAFSSRCFLSLLLSSFGCVIWGNDTTCKTSCFRPSIWAIFFPIFSIGLRSIVHDFIGSFSLWWMINFVFFSEPLFYLIIVRLSSNGILIINCRVRPGGGTLCPLSRAAKLFSI